MVLIRELLKLLTHRERWVALWLLVMLVFGASMDALGIGLILPYVAFLERPQKVFAEPVVDLFFRTVHVTSDHGIILVLSACLIAFFFFKNVYLYVQWRLIYGFIARKQAETTALLLSEYADAPYGFHTEQNSADLIRDVREAENVFTGLMAPLAMLIKESFLAVLTAVILIVLQLVTGQTAVTTLLALGVMALAVLVLVRILQRRVTALGRVRVTTRGLLLRSTYDVLGGIKELKVLGREQYFLDAFRGDALRVADADRQNRLYQEYPRLGLETFTVVGIVVIMGGVYLGGSQLETALPTLAMLGVAVVRLMPSATRIFNSFSMVRFSVPSLDTVTRQLSQVRAAKGPRRSYTALRPLPFEKSIQAEDISFRYPSASVLALSDVSFRITPGESVAFIGASGSGKTTLVNIMLGLLQPASGHIAVDGVNIRDNLQGWQHLIGYIPQEIYLSDDSIRRNVAFGIPEDQVNDEAVWRALEMAQIRTFVEGLDQGLDTVMGERGIRMSGGQRQRIGIARALYHDPAVLVLDEATSSLDHTTEQGVMRAIEALAGNKTIVIITHRLNAVRSCDRVYVLRSGQIVESGKLDDLRERLPDLRELSGLQLGVTSS